MLKHRYDKSSWNVHFYLQKLRELNLLLVRRDVKAVWDLLTKIAKKKKAPKSSKILGALQELDKAKKAINVIAPKCTREMGILNNYIRREQAHNRLPHIIPEEYKMKLLLPMALHARAMIRFDSVRSKLSRGPPKVTISHTATMGSKIWFVRSALNKKKRQSKALGVLIRREKRQSRNRWEALTSCKVAAGWALQEAIWEHLIQWGSIPAFDLEKYLEPSSLEERKSQSFPVVEEWLAPIQESFLRLKELNRAKVAYFRNYKDDILLKGGQMQYYGHKSEAFHHERLQRFRKMANTDLPYVVPFIPGHDLSSIMAKYRL